MSTVTDDEAPTGPRPAKAIFSSEDFRLLKIAVATHLKTIADSPESAKFSSLYHRLGRGG